MHAADKSALLFLLGCMPVRVALAVVAKMYPHLLPTFGMLALIPAIGFMAIYLTNTRKTGLETFGRPIWWNNLRPIHSFLYFAFAAAAMHKSPDAWMILAIDVIIGTLAFFIHRFL
jgi:hypothetical protein